MGTRLRDDLQLVQLGVYVRDGSTPGGRGPPERIGIRLYGELLPRGLSRRLGRGRIPLV